MADRYYVETPLASGKATLAGAEAHHLTHVMRAKPGTEVVLFDGLGFEAAAQVESLGRSRVELRIHTIGEVDRESEIELTLGVALPKGDRRRWLVEKAVELGVQRLVPLKLQRGVAISTAGARDRMRRTVIESCKQCGRNRLMEIAVPLDWPHFVASDAVDHRWIAHPGGENLSSLARLLIAPNDAANDRPRTCMMAIGPEGGFSDKEISLAVSSGWRIVDLGPRILRVETAAALLAAVVGIAGSSD